MKRHRRAGTSLIETLVMGTLISLTLSSMTILTHTLFISSRQIADAGQVRQVISRLQSRVFADSVTGMSARRQGSDSVTTWQVLLPEERTVTYRVDSRTIERVVKSAEGLIEHRDEFQLPATYQFTALGNDQQFEVHVERQQAATREEAESFERTGLRVIAIWPRSTMEAAP